MSRLIDVDELFASLSSFDLPGDRIDACTLRAIIAKLPKTYKKTELPHIEWNTPCFTLNEYQRRASRTINRTLDIPDIIGHSLMGLSAETGELLGIYQKQYQGHKLEPEHLKKEAGDILWMLAEWATANGWTLGEIAEMNIEKLEARYPNGFEAEKSLNRREGDI